MSDLRSAIEARVTEAGKPENDLLHRIQLPPVKMAESGKLSLSDFDLPQMLKNKPELKNLDWAPPPSVVDSKLDQKAMQLVKPEPVVNEAQVNAAARDLVFSQLSLDARKSLDALRLRLSICTSPLERQERNEEISKFLRSSLGEKLSDQGLKAVLAAPNLGDVFAEIQKKRPGELLDLINEARSRVLVDAKSAIADGAKHKDFENKVALFDKRAGKDGLSSQELLGTYLQIARVLDPSLKLEHADKSLLSRSMIANACDPTSIDQGGHMTCNVTALEVRHFTQEPGTACKVIADLACAGHFVTADGTIVRPRDLDPDGESKLDLSDGSRNYASQLYQVTAINAHWNRRETLPGGVTLKKGQIQYVQGPDGEALIDTSVDPPRKHGYGSINSAQPWLDIFAVSDINEQLTGRPSKNFGMRRWFHSGEEDGVSKIFSLEGFKEKLSAFKNEQAFPVLIEVDAAKKPFGDGKGFGPHVVTITDYDPATGLVTVDNQWGKGADMTGLPGEKPKVPVAELFSSMNMIPGSDFIWERVKDELKGLKLRDSIPPTVSALSTKGLFWGLGSAAPLAVRSGLGYMGELGVPGAASMLSASETRLGRMGLRAGTSLAALGAFAYVNNLPAAFNEGTSHGVGKLSRVTGDWASFELARMLGNKATFFVPWAPARFGFSLAAGVASSWIFDRLLGDACEIGGSRLYDNIHDALKPNRQLSAPDKAVKPDPPPALGSRDSLSQLGNGSLSNYFQNRQLNFAAPYGPFDSPHALK